MRRRRRGLGFKADGLLDEPLEERVVWAYAAGHVLNDASAACWFSYLLIYRELLSGVGGGGTDGRGGRARAVCILYTCDGDYHSPFDDYHSPFDDQPSASDIPPPRGAQSKTSGT